MEKGNDHDNPLGDVPSPGEPPGNGGEPQYQPPSPTDLRQHPPSGAACARVRALLRDYTDHDLSAAERESVDEHAHECRECGVALSRVEAEVYRLRRALRATPQVVSPDFVARVMARVRAEPAAKEPAADDAAVSADFTPRVMERIRREWKRTSLASRARAFGRRHVFSLIGVAAAAVAVVWLRVGMRWDVAAVRVVSAENAEVRHGDRRSELAAGDALQPGDDVRVGPRGSARLAVRQADREGERASLELEAETAVEVRGRGDAVRAALFRLAAGTMALRVQADDGLVFGVGEHCQIELEAGAFTVFAEPVARHDGRLAVDPRFTGVRLTALQGRAHVVRGAARVTVEAGFVALFDDWSAVVIERHLTDADLAAAGVRRDIAVREPTVSRPASDADWIGRVINAHSNAGVAAASVTFRLQGKEPQTVFTGNDGSFRLRGLGDLQGAVAMVEVTLTEGTPPTTFGNLANFVSPVTMRSTGVGPQLEQQLEPIRLPRERLIMGTVFDPERRRLAGARVTPIVVDTLAGAAKRLPPVVADVVTDSDGRFSLRRLPEVLPPYVDVYLLVEHALHGTVATADLLAEPSVRDQAVEVTMARRERVSVSELPAGQRAEILASIRNLAPSAMLQVSRVTIDAAGTVELDVAEGSSLWLRHDMTLVPLVAYKDRPTAWHRGEGAIAPSIGALAMQPSARAAVLARGFWRYDVIAASGSERRTVALMDREGHDLAGAQLFLVSSDGAMRYLGEMTSAQAEWAVPAGTDYKIVAVTEDGAVGMVEAADLQENMLRLRMAAPGAARLPDDLIGELSAAVEQRGGFAVFELHMVEPLPDYVVVRHAGRDSGWEMRGLIPGSYRFTTADNRSYGAEVPPGGRGVFIRRDPGQSGIR